MHVHVHQAPRARSLGVGRRVGRDWKYAKPRARSPTPPSALSDITRGHSGRARAPGFTCLKPSLLCVALAVASLAFRDPRATGDCELCPPPNGVVEINMSMVMVN